MMRPSQGYSILPSLLALLLMSSATVLLMHAWPARHSHLEAARCAQRAAQALTEEAEHLRSLSPMELSLLAQGPQADRVKDIDSATQMTSRRRLRPASQEGLLWAEWHVTWQDRLGKRQVRELRLLFRLAPNEP